MSIFVTLEHSLLAFANQVPLEFFALIGSFVEELVAPIPSPLVMATAGSIAKLQGQGFFFLMEIALIAAVSKTATSWIYYFIADKAEDVLTKRLGRFIGFSHKEVEGIGKYFNGTIKDDVILVLLRAFPLMPSPPVSIACGFIKLNIITYLRSTLIGSFFRSFVFLYLGYSGLEIYRSLLNGIDSIQSLMNIIIGLVILGVFAFIYYKRGKGDIHEWLKKKIGK
ncbi:MAG: VTT domain-containing protein [Patescibacteria group bacterium]|nr:VTT domain-containing protein [Patescibacteria group bacterium]